MRPQVRHFWKGSESCWQAADNQVISENGDEIPKHRR
jgi:hypothetical protein